MEAAGRIGVFHGIHSRISWGGRGGTGLMELPPTAKGIEVSR